jgi:hypothetical protein
MTNQLTATAAIYPLIDAVKTPNIYVRQGSDMGLAIRSISTLIHYVTYEQPTTQRNANTYKNKQRSQIKHIITDK